MPEPRRATELGAPHLAFEMWFYVLTAMLLLLAISARAQGNYEIQVYGADTVEPKSLMVELHSNFTPEGQKNLIDGVYPTNHQEHETIELTEGLTSWSEVGFYIFTSEQAGHGVQWVGDHIRRCRTHAHADVDLPLGRDVQVGDGKDLLLLVVQRVGRGDASVVGVVFEAQVDLLADVVSEGRAGREAEALRHVRPMPRALPDHLIVKGILGRRFDWATTRR